MKNACGGNAYSKEFTAKRLITKVLDIVQHVKYSDVIMHRICRVTENITKGYVGGRYHLTSPEG